VLCEQVPGVFSFQSGVMRHVLLHRCLALHQSIIVQKVKAAHPELFGLREGEGVQAEEGEEGDRFSLGDHSCSVASIAQDYGDRLFPDSIMEGRSPDHLLTASSPCLLPTHAPFLSSMY
jgi:hypothetical protein